VCSHNYRRLIKYLSSISDLWLDLAKIFQVMIAIFLHLPMADHHLGYKEFLQKTMMLISLFSWKWGENFVSILKGIKKLRFVSSLRDDVNLIWKCSYQCWSGMDFWTYQPGQGIGYFWTFYNQPAHLIAYFKNFQTSLILVLGPWLIFGWCGANTYFVLELV